MLLLKPSRGASRHDSSETREWARERTSKPRWGLAQRFQKEYSYPLHPRWVGEKDGNGPPEDLDVHKERFMVDVVNIERYFFFERQFRSAAHLREAGEARFCERQAFELRRILLDFSRFMRSWADESNVA